MLSVHGKPSVSTEVSFTSPDPAIPSLVNVLPKAIFCGDLVAPYGASVTTKTTTRILGGGSERGLTERASLCYGFTSHDLNLRHRLGLWLGPRMRRNLMCGPLCIIALLLMVSPVYSQRASDVDRLSKALGQALDRITDLETKARAADEAIDALKAEREAAQAALAAARGERESLERQVALAEKAIAAQQKVVQIYEQAIELQAKLIDRHEKRIDNLEVKLDKANSRTVKAGVFGFLAGIAATLVKAF